MGKVYVYELSGSNDISKSIPLQTDTTGGEDYF